MESMEGVKVNGNIGENVPLSTERDNVESQTQKNYINDFLPKKDNSHNTADNNVDGMKPDSIKENGIDICNSGDKEISTASKGMELDGSDAVVNEIPKSKEHINEKNMDEFSAVENQESERDICADKMKEVLSEGLAGKDESHVMEDQESRDVEDLSINVDKKSKVCFGNEEVEKEKEKDNKSLGSEGSVEMVDQKSHEEEREKADDYKADIKASKSESRTEEEMPMEVDDHESGNKSLETESANPAEVEAIDNSISKEIEGVLPVDKPLQKEPTSNAEQTETDNISDTMEGTIVSDKEQTIRTEKTELNENSENEGKVDITEENGEICNDGVMTKNDIKSSSCDSVKSADEAQKEDDDRIVKSECKTNLKLTESSTDISEISNISTNDPQLVNENTQEDKSDMSKEDSDIDTKDKQEKSDGDKLDMPEKSSALDSKDKLEDEKSDTPEANLTVDSKDKLEKLEDGKSDTPEANMAVDSKDKQEKSEDSKLDMPEANTVVDTDKQKKSGDDKSDTPKANLAVDMTDKQENSEDMECDKKVKSVDTVTDIDGSEFIITINEDDSGSEKEEEVVKQDVNKSNNSQNIVTKTETSKDTTPITIQPKAVKDTKPVMSLLNTPKSQTSHFFVQNSVSQHLAQSHIKSSAGTTVQYCPVQIPSGSGFLGSQYMQSIMVGGKSVLVPVSSAGTQQYVIDKKNGHSLVSKQTIAASKASATNTVVAPSPTSAKQGTGQMQNVYSVNNGIESKERDADLPLASWEMLDLVKWEVASHKPDNTFWIGLCNVNKKAEISSTTKFLFDLGSDIVKESAYKQITHVQTKKKEAGKLNDVEKENLEKMKKVVKELEDKLSHMALEQQKCSCGFHTESQNVMFFHKEHPHMDPPLNPHGLMNCAHCDFEANDGTKFSFHMEAEHNMVGRVYSKPAFWQCGLCYYEHNSKNKLTNHKWKCMKHFKANQNQAPHHTDVNYCLKNIFYQYQIKKTPPPKPQQPQHQHFTRKASTTPVASQKQPPAIQPRKAQGPLLANQLQQKINLQRPVIRASTQIPGVVYSNQAAALGNFNKNVPQLNTTNQTIRNPMQVVVRQPPASKPTVNQLLLAKGPSQKVIPNQSMAVASKQPARPVQSSTPATPPTSNSNTTAFEVCEICGGYVKDRMSLRIHFFYAHKIDIPQHVFNRACGPLLCEVCNARFWTTHGLSKHRAATKHSLSTPKQPSFSVSGDNTCWICHQRQDNLYTHLLQFHRLSTGECMALRRCMFCGTLSSNRKDLEIHMAAAHGVLIKGGNASNSSQKPPAATPKQTGPKTVLVGSKPSVTTQGKGSGLVRNNFCVFCSKQFPDNTQLTLHCLGTHATCSSCGMVVAKHSDLKTHVCRSNTVRNCQLCGVRNLKSSVYTKHMLTHMKKCSVRLKRLSKEQITKATARKIPFSGTVVVDLRSPEDRKRSLEGDRDGEPGSKKMRRNEVVLVD